MHDGSAVPPLQFILKVASRCNLDCSYCYVYNKGDDGWRRQPKFMSRAIAVKTLERIRRHCEQSGQDCVRITFHGGEPCVIGHDRFSELCKLVHAAIEPVCPVEISLQTNGTLLDERWVEIFLEHSVSVGVSLDGPPEVHDALRVDHAGRGSYAGAARGLRLLVEAGVPAQVLCVIQLGADGAGVHQHLLATGARRINYLLPDFTHDEIASVRAEHGLTPVADFLLPVLELWHAQQRLDVLISPFTDMTRVVLGGDSYIDLLGNRPYQYVFVESDGSIQGLDVLRICGRNMTVMGLHVDRDDFAAIPHASTLHGQIMLAGPRRPAACESCIERDSCGGGYLPHRHSAVTGFDNPSVWCLDLLALFGRLRELLGVRVEETALRRQALMELTGVV
jgi:uncharacterized protein